MAIFFLQRVPSQSPSSPHRIRGTTGQGGSLMTRYDIRLHTDKGVQIYDKGAECTPAEIPEMLACAVMDYLKDSPYPGAIHAQVMTDRRCTEYVLLLRDGSLDVYRHVERATRVEVQEHPAGSAPPRDKEEI